MDETNANKKGVILCLLSTIFFSLGPITGKLLFSTGLPWQVVVTCRAMIPAILIFLYALLFNREVFRIKKEHLPLFMLNALFFGFISICNYCSLYYIDAAVATVLLNTLPIFTVLLSRLILKEAFTVPKILAMIFTFCGVILIIQIGNLDSISAGNTTTILGIPSTVLGIITGLLSGLLSGLYTIFTRKLNQFYSGWTVNSWCYMMAFPIFFMVGIPKISTFDWTWGHLGSIVIVALIGLTAYSLYSLSIHYIEAGKAGLLVTLDPAFSITMSVFILGEELSPIQVVGCVLVFIGIITMEKGKAIWQKFFPQKEKPHAAS